MKLIHSILLILTFISLSGFAQARDVSAAKFLTEIKTRVFLENTKQAHRLLSAINSSIGNYKSEKNTQSLSEARASFAQLVAHWKSIEVVYIAGSLDEDMIDHPRFVDHYHQGNVPIKQTLDIILQSDNDLKKAMFKSSSKGINALEIFLFDELPDSERRWRAALISVQHISDWLSEINRFYQSDKSFVQGQAQSVEMLINALIDSSYRLSNWRIGEPAGRVAKYRDQPSTERLEYHTSGLSMSAIHSILETHHQVFQIAQDTGYFSETGRSEGLSEVRFVMTKIEQALDASRTVSIEPELDVESVEFIDLFNRVEALHKAYYFLLLDALKLQGKIVDADGD
jgi:predicted lipoprotein